MTLDGQELPSVGQTWSRADGGLYRVMEVSGRDVMVRVLQKGRLPDHRQRFSVTNLVLSDFCHELYRPYMMRVG